MGIERQEALVSTYLVIGKNHLKEKEKAHIRTVSPADTEALNPQDKSIKGNTKSDFIQSLRFWKASMHNLIYLNKTHNLVLGKRNGCKQTIPTLFYTKVTFSRTGIMIFNIYLAVRASP
jgi:hypothetical protein